MADSALVFPAGLRLTDSETGAPLSGGIIRFFDAGTTTPKTVYSDSGLTVAIGTTSTTDALGYPTSDGGSTKTLIYVGTSPYKVTVETSTGSVLATHDNVKGAVAVTDIGDLSVVFSRPVVVKSLDYTVVDGDQSKVIPVNCSGGDVTITLPSAATVGDGWFVTLQHAGSANQCVVATVSSQTIASGHLNYSTSLALSTSGEEVTLVSDGGNWRAFGHTSSFFKSAQGVLSIVDRLSSPPGSPDQGDLYILTATPSGAWSSFAEHDVAQYTGAGWVRLTPIADCGWHAVVADEDKVYRFLGSAWVAEDATTSRAGTVQLADAAAMEARTAGRAVPADMVDRHPAVPKAWVLFNGTGTPAITSSYNVSSIVDNGTGDYTVNFGVTFSNTNWVWSGGTNAMGLFMFEEARTASSIRVGLINTGGGRVDASRICLALWGDI